MSTISRELAKARKQLNQAARSLEEVLGILEEEREAKKGEPKPFLTERDLAEAFGKHLYTIQRWRREGKLDPYHQQGRTYYWLREDFERLLEENSKK